MVKRFKSQIMNLAISLSVGSFSLFGVIKFQSIQLQELTEGNLTEKLCPA